MCGSNVLLNNPPKARSLLPSAPKLYVSPAMSEPVPALYTVLALVLVSRKCQPVGTTVLLIPVVAKISKSWVYGTPNEVRGTVPSARAGTAVAMASSAVSSETRKTHLRPRPKGKFFM